MVGTNLRFTANQQTNNGERVRTADILSNRMRAQQQVLEGKHEKKERSRQGQSDALG